MKLVGINGVDGLGFTQDPAQSAAIERWMAGEYTWGDRLGCMNPFAGGRQRMHPDVPAVLGNDWAEVKKWPCTTDLGQIILNETAHAQREQQGGEVGQELDVPAPAEATTPSVWTSPYLWGGILLAAGMVYLAYGRGQGEGDRRTPPS